MCSCAWQDCVATVCGCPCHTGVFPAPRSSDVARLYSDERHAQIAEVVTIWQAGAPC